MKWNEIHQLATEMVEQQKKLLLKVGRKVVPTLTPEDMLQPNDYNELEHNPIFRYEEGLLAGLQSMQIALKVLENESSTADIQLEADKTHHSIQK
jgi:hypothetical protein